MSLTVNTNIASLSTQKWLNISTTKQAGALEQLSSGSKINKASDDAAGLAISTKLTVKVVSLYKAIDNGNQAVAMLQTAEGGLSTISDILTRLKELATEAASGNNATDRGSLQLERNKLEDQITNIASGTKYGATQLLAGTASSIDNETYVAADGITSIATSASAAPAVGYTVTTAAGSVSGLAMTITNAVTGASQTVEFDAPAAGTTQDISFGSLGLTVKLNENIAAAVSETFDVAAGTDTSFTYQLGDTNFSYNQVTATIGGVSLDNLGLAVAGTRLTAWVDNDNGTNEQTYLDTVNTAIDYVNSQRAGIGSFQSQINFQVSNMTITVQNTEAAASTIKDADYAKSMSEFSKYQVMTQAGVAMLAQANQMPQQVLSLLKG